MKASAGRVLVTGSSGQVGEALTRTLAPLGEILALGHAALDLTDEASIRRTMQEFRPRWVVNAAAHTAVDKAESEPELAFAINARAPQVFAEEARKIGAVIIHFSTDYVFDGSKSIPYVESDPTAPLNVYGSSKLAGETALSANNVPYFIFRTSWVYGATGKNFLRSILRLARERDHLRIVADQHGAPTWSFDLARMTAYVISQVELQVEAAGCSLSQVVAPMSGVYHATGGGETTWYGFAAEAIAELQKREPDGRFATLEAIPSSEYPTPAKRPLNSLLDCTKLGEVLQWHMPNWRSSLSQAIAQLLEIR